MVYNEFYNELGNVYGILNKQKFPESSSPVSNEKWCLSKCVLSINVSQ